MNRTIACCVLLLVAAGFSRAFAQESPAYEQLKAHEALIGTWIYDGPLLEAAPGVAKGTPVVIKFCWKWVLDKQAVVSSWTARLGGDAQRMSGQSLVGWDPVKKQVVGSGFTSHGHRSTSTGRASEESKDSNTFAAQITNHTAEGEQETFGSVIELTDADTLTWQIVDREDDVLPPESPKYVFKRVKQDTQAKLPEAFVKMSDYFVGDWDTEVEIDGKVYRGTWTARWSQDHTCLVTYWAADSPDGPARGTRVQGWDDAAKKFLIVDFGTGGSFSIERYTIVSDEVDEGQMHGIDAEGKPIKATARTFKQDRDFFTWTVTRDGEVIEYKFRRTSE